MGRGVLLALAGVLAATPIACRKVGGIPLPMEDQAPAMGEGALPPVTVPDASVVAASDWHIEDPGTPPFSRSKLLAAFAECTRAGVGTFVDRARTLEAAAAAYADDANDENLDAVRRAWGEAMNRWQELELFQFGPAAKPEQPGGLDLRAEIYVWPLFNGCMIDSFLTDPTKYSGGALAIPIANTRGLGGLEYVLFAPNDENACASTNPINVVDAATAESPWDRLVNAGLEGTRADYAVAAAEVVTERAETLASAWEGFQLAEGDTYPTTQDAINAVSDALFYLDTEVKDMKLAEPLGLMEECLAAPCPTESALSGWSKSNIRNNLRGFQRLFSGCNGGAGFGFDDLLADLGPDGAASAQRMESALVQSIQALDGIEEPTLEAAIVNDPESVAALHGSVKALTSDMQADFVALLALRLPAVVETDND